MGPEPSIIVRYNENQAIGASKITLKFDNAPLKEVLDEFTRQCGVSHEIAGTMATIGRAYRAGLPPIT